MQQLFEHLVATYNAPFAIALAVFGMFGALQVIGFLLGSEWFSFMDDWLPDVDAGGDLGADAGLGGALSLLYVGRVPFAITLLAWLFAFAALGYNLQLALIVLGLAPMGAGWAALLSFTASLPVIAAANRALARVLPSDETRAISEDDLVGLSGEVTLGTVTSERASEAKFRDRHGSTHYVQVVSDEAGESFARGEQVLIVGRSGHLYTVVRDPLCEKKG